MKRIKRLVRRPFDTAGAAIAAVNEWQSEIAPEGRVVLVGLVLVSLGLAIAGPAATVPGGILVAIGIGMDFRHPLTAVALVLSGAAVVIVVLLEGPH